MSGDGTSLSRGDKNVYVSHFGIIDGVYERLGEERALKSRNEITWATKGVFDEGCVMAFGLFFLEFAFFRSDNY